MDFTGQVAFDFTARGLTQIRNDMQAFGKDISQNLQQTSKWQQQMAQLQRGLSNPVGLKDLHDKFKAVNVVMNDSSKTGVITRDAFASMQAGVSANLGEFSGGLSKARTELTLQKDLIHQYGTNLVTLGKNAQWTGRQLTIGLTVPLVGVGIQAVQAFTGVNREFTRMARIIGEDNAFTDKMKEFRKQAQELGDEFHIVTQKVASQFADISAQGVEPEAIPVVAKQVLRTSLLGDTDVNTANKFVRVLRADFAPAAANAALQMKFVEDAVSRFDAVANVTSIMLGDLVEAFPRVALSAKQFGLTADQTGAILAGMFQRGVPAEEGANALRFALIRITAPATAAKKAWNEIFAGGKSDAKDSIETIGKMTNGMDKLAVITDKIFKSGLSPNQQLGLLSKLVGNRQSERALAAFSGIAAGDGKNAQDELKKLNKVADDISKAAIKGDKSYKHFFEAGTAGMNDFQKAIVATKIKQELLSEGATLEMKIKLSSPEEQLKLLKKQFQDFLVLLGQEILPPLIRVMDKFIGILKKFGDLPDPFKKMIIGVAGLLAVIGPLNLVFGQSLEIVGSLAKGVAALIPGLRAIDPAMLEIMGGAENFKGKVVQGAGKTFQIGGSGLKKNLEFDTPKDTMARLDVLQRRAEDKGDTRAAAQIAAAKQQVATAADMETAAVIRASEAKAADDLANKKLTSSEAALAGRKEAVAAGEVLPESSTAQFFGKQDEVVPARQISEPTPARLAGKAEAVAEDAGQQVAQTAANTADTAAQAVEDAVENVKKSGPVIPGKYQIPTAVETAGIQLPKEYELPKPPKSGPVRPAKDYIGHPERRNLEKLTGDQLSEQFDFPTEGTGSFFQIPKAPDLPDPTKIHTRIEEISKELASMEDKFGPSYLKGSDKAKALGSEKDRLEGFLAKLGLVDPTRLRSRVEEIKKELVAIENSFGPSYLKGSDRVKALISERNKLEQIVGTSGQAIPPTGLRQFISRPQTGTSAIDTGLLTRARPENLPGEQVRDRLLQGVEAAKAAPEAPAMFDMKGLASKIDDDLNKVDTSKAQKTWRKKLKSIFDVPKTALFGESAAQLAQRQADAIENLPASRKQAHRQALDLFEVDQRREDGPDKLHLQRPLDLTPDEPIIKKRGLVSKAAHAFEEDVTKIDADGINRTWQGKLRRMFYIPEDGGIFKSWKNMIDKELGMIKRYAIKAATPISIPLKSIFKKEAEEGAVKKPALEGVRKLFRTRDKVEDKSDDPGFGKIGTQLRKITAPLVSGIDDGIKKAGSHWKESFGKEAIQAFKTEGLVGKIKLGGKGLSNAVKSMLSLGGGGGKGGIGALTGGFTALIPIIGLSVTAIAAFTAAAAGIIVIILFVKNLAKHWDEVRKGMQKGIDALKEGWNSIKEAVGGVISIFSDAISKVLGGGGKGGQGKTFWEGFGELLGKIGRVGGSAMKAIARGIELLKPYWELLADQVANVIGFIDALFSGDWVRMLKAAARIVLDVFVAPVALLLDGLKNVIANALGWIVDHSIKPLTSAVGGLFHLLAKVPGMGWAKGVGDAIQDFGKGIRGVITDLNNSVSFTGMLDKFKDTFLDITTETSTQAKDKWDKNFAVPVKQIFKETGEQIAKGISEGAADALEKFKAFLSELKNQIQQQVGEMKDIAQSAFDEIIEKEKEAFDAQGDKKLAIYDNQIAAIDAVIKAEERKFAAEEYLERRREMLAKHELDRENYMRERALAIYEGRINDVRMMDLGEEKRREDAAKELKDLDTGENRRKTGIKRDDSKEALSKQRANMEKAVEAERKAFAKMQELEKKAFAHQLNELTKYTPKGPAEYKKMIDQINQLVVKFGGNPVFPNAGSLAVNNLRKAVEDTFKALNEADYWSAKGSAAGYGWISGFQSQVPIMVQAVVDAQQKIADAMGDGSGTSQATRSLVGTQWGNFADPQKFINNIQDFAMDKNINADIARIPGITIGAKGPEVSNNQDFLNWLLMTGAAKVTTDDKGIQSIKIDQTKLAAILPRTKTQSGRHNYRHGGGFIDHLGGNRMPDVKSDEVPTILQAGEFVIRRDAVSKIGAGTLSGMNASPASFIKQIIKPIDSDPKPSERKINPFLEFVRAKIERIKANRLVDFVKPIEKRTSVSPLADAVRSTEKDDSYKVITNLLKSVSTRKESPIINIIRPLEKKRETSYTFKPPTDIDRGISPVVNYTKTIGQQKNVVASPDDTVKEAVDKAGATATPATTPGTDQDGATTQPVFSTGSGSAPGTIKDVRQDLDEGWKGINSDTKKNWETLNKGVSDQFDKMHGTSKDKWGKIRSMTKSVYSVITSDANVTKNNNVRVWTDLGVKTKDAWSQTHKTVGDWADKITVKMHGAPPAWGGQLKALPKAMGEPISWTTATVINFFVDQLNKFSSQAGMGKAFNALSTPKYHTGGIVGQAPQKHDPRTPLHHDEQVAVLKKGEGVLPVKTMKKIGPATFKQMIRGTDIVKEVPKVEPKRAPRMDHTGIGEPVNKVIKRDDKSFLNRMIDRTYQDSVKRLVRRDNKEALSTKTFDRSHHDSLRKVIERQTKELFFNKLINRREDSKLRATHTVDRRGVGAPVNRMPDREHRTIQRNDTKSYLTKVIDRITKESHLRDIVDAKNRKSFFKNLIDRREDSRLHTTKMIDHSGIGAPVNKAHKNYSVSDIKKTIKNKLDAHNKIVERKDITSYLNKLVNKVDSKSHVSKTVDRMGIGEPIKKLFSQQHKASDVKSLIKNKIQESHSKMLERNAIVSHLKKFITREDHKSHVNDVVNRKDIGAPVNRITNKENLVSNLVKKVIQRRAEESHIKNILMKSKKMASKGMGDPLGDRFLAAVRVHESNNNYKSPSHPEPGGGYHWATGAYQIMRDTWAGYAGYPEAYLAPPPVQDAKANQLLGAMRNLPAAANDPKLWSAGWYGGGGAMTTLSKIPFGQGMWDVEPNAGLSYEKYALDILRLMGEKNLPISTSGGAPFDIKKIMFDRIAKQFANMQAGPMKNLLFAVSMKMANATAFKAAQIQDLSGKGADSGIGDEPAPIPEGKGAELLQAWKGRQGSYQAIIKYMEQSGVPFRVNSTYRPGAISAGGGQSLHGFKRAVDFGGPNGEFPTAQLDAVYRVWRSAIGYLSELFYSRGDIFKDHAGIHPVSMMDAADRANHYSHVHVGLAKGGIVKAKTGGVKARIAEGGQDEIVMPLTKFNIDKYMTSFSSPQMIKQMMATVTKEVQHAIPQAAATSHAEHSEHISQTTIYVDNFIGEKAWFEQMMKQYDVKVVPAGQKKKGIIPNKVSSYSDNAKRFR